MKASRSLWEYYRDEPALTDAPIIDYFPADNNNNSVSFKFKQKVKSQTGFDDRKDDEIVVPVKYLTNF